MKRVYQSTTDHQQELVLEPCSGCTRYAMRSCGCYSSWQTFRHYIQSAPKNVPLFCYPYLRQLVTDFQNCFTDALFRQLAIMWLLYIPPHHKCVSTLPCEISMKYAYVTTITNKHSGKIDRRTLQANTAVNGLYDTKLCGSNTISVIQIIHRNVGLKCFFSFT